MEIAQLILEFTQVLIWPVTVLSVCVLFRRQVAALLNRVRHAELPGGVAIDLDKELVEIGALSAKVQELPSPAGRSANRPAIPLTEANARMLQLGLRPSPSGLDMSYYRSLADQDPNIALAGLRIEIDILARNLAAGFDLEVTERDSGGRLVRRLYDKAAITGEQMQLTMKVLKVCNAAVHGTPVSREEADEVVDSAEVLTDQYLEWLGWGFNDGWAPKNDRDAG